MNGKYELTEIDENENFFFKFEIPLEISLDSNSISFHNKSQNSMKFSDKVRNLSEKLPNSFSFSRYFKNENNILWKKKDDVFKNCKNKTTFKKISNENIKNKVILTQFEEEKRNFSTPGNGLIDINQRRTSIFYKDVSSKFKTIMKNYETLEKKNKKTQTEDIILENKKSNSFSSVNSQSEFCVNGINLKNILIKTFKNYRKNYKNMILDATKNVFNQFYDVKSKEVKTKPSQINISKRQTINLKIKRSGFGSSGNLE